MKNTGDLFFWLDKSSRREAPAIRNGFDSDLCKGRGGSKHILMCYMLLSTFNSVAHSNCSSLADSSLSDYSATMQRYFTTNQRKYVSTVPI